jgi:hypothetical protein
MLKLDEKYKMSLFYKFAKIFEFGLFLTHFPHNSSFSIFASQEEQIVRSEERRVKITENK